MEYAPVVRIILRYAVGAGLMGSAPLGDQLATDPDLVFYGCAAIGLLVEIAYGLAKKWGKST